MPDELVLDTKCLTEGDMAERATYHRYIDQLEREVKGVEARITSLKEEYRRKETAFKEKHGMHSWDVYECDAETSAEIRLLVKLENEIDYLEEAQIDGLRHQLHRARQAEQNGRAHGNDTHANDLWRSICTNLEILLDDPENMDIQDAAVFYLEQLQEWIQRGGIPPNVQYED